MKTILTFIINVKRDEDGFLHARVKTLPHCYTQARDFNTLFKRLNEVILLCLEEKAEEEKRIKAALKHHIDAKREALSIPSFIINATISSELLV